MRVPVPGVFVLGQLVLGVLEVLLLRLLVSKVLIPGISISVVLAWGLILVPKMFELEIPVVLMLEISADGVGVLKDLRIHLQ